MDSSNDTLPQHSSNEETPATHQGFAFKLPKKNITTSFRERRKRSKQIKFELPEDEDATTSVYFDDGRRLIDYVLVYNSEFTSDLRETFLEGIIDAGLETEETPSVMDENMVFVKIHAPKVLLQKYAEKFEIPIKKMQTTFIRPPIPKFAFLRTELTAQDPNSPNFHRAPETFSRDKPKKFLTYERSLIVFNVLKRIEYGPEIFDNGIERLIDDFHFCSAFPLHDGTYKWNDNPTEPLNDRQILYKFWAHTNMIFKTQPVDTIGRYFGYNTALYFGWLSFYNKMLLLPVLLGVLVHMINICGYFYRKIYEITKNEVCESELIVCPACPDCECLPLSYYCVNYHLSNMFDSRVTVIFSIFISIWAAVYMGLWKRKQAVYAIRWNIQDSELEEQDMRQEFENFAQFRMSEFGEPDLYIPWYIRLYRIVFTTSAICLILVVVIMVISSIIIIQIVMTHVMNNNVLSTSVSSMLTVLTILLMRRVCIGIYNSIVIWLVNYEVPQTQTDFDNSYILKLFLFSFVNNYGSLIYLAFFKGKNYTHPNDPKMYDKSSNYLIDICDPSGCFSEVHTQLGIIMLLLPTISNIIRYIKSRYRAWRYRKIMIKLRASISTIPQWEKDYELCQLTSEELLLMYEEMVTQFGFVTLFAFAFPLAPFIAWINSLIKTQIDANILVTECRRPNPRRTANIGAWLDIMKFLTYLSVLSNACYVAFTSDILNKIFYMYKTVNNTSLEGYIEHFLSIYWINLDHWPKAGVPNGTICYYPGQRYDPYEYDDDQFHHIGDDPFDYTYDYFRLIMLKCGFILIFENVILGLTALIFYSLPDVPQEVKSITATRTIRSRKFLENEGSITSDSVLRLNQPAMNQNKHKIKKRHE